MPFRSMRIFAYVIACTGSLISGAAAWAYNYPVQVTAYGAKCDGVTDDTAAISAAISAAGSGGTVQFPAGTCVVMANSTITLSDVSIVGSPSAHNSQGSNYTEAGTNITIGTINTAPGTAIPFFLGHSLTIRDINFIYPYTIAHVTGTPPPQAALFEDDGVHGAGNILFDNVHAIAPYVFWRQQGGNPAPAYGNIRFNNVDVYATAVVFEWSNTKEAVFLNNFLSNPSLCSSDGVECSAGLRVWTSNNGVWLHIVGSGSANTERPSVGIGTSNLVVVAYRTGVLIDQNGHMDESIFGPTTVWDGVPTVLNVNSNGSITHSVFSGKMQYNGPVVAAAFLLNNPQFPLPGSANQDHNTISLNGFTADGTGAEFLYARATTGDISSISLVGVVVRDYCINANTFGVDINAPNAVVTIVGSQITNRHPGNTCNAGLSVTANPSFSQIANNNTGYYANQ